LKFETFFEKIRENIFHLCQALNFTPTPDQAAVLRLVQLERDLPHSQQKRRIAVRSGQGAGKTSLSCVVMIWRQIQHKDALGVVTAPTARQLRKVWLTEMRRMVLKAHPAIQSFIEVTKSEVIFFNRTNWVIVLVSSAKPGNAQGLHQEHMTIMIDEMSGVPDEIITQFLGTLSNADSLLVGIGNPNFRSGTFYRAFNKDKPLWHTWRISTEGCPIVDQENVRRLERTFGRNSDVFRIRVLGEFPLTDPNVLFDIGQLETCSEHDIVRFAAASATRTFGIDLARFGNDESTIFQRSGSAITRWKRFVKREPADVLREALRWSHESGWTDSEFIVDVGGLGGGAVHVLHEAGVKVTEFYFNNTASDAQFGNRITEAYFNLSYLVKESEVAIPEDDLLIKELVERQYGYNPKNQLIIEAKKDFKLRMDGQSPDRADGCVLAFAPSTMSGTMVFRQGDAKMPSADRTDGSGRSHGKSFNFGGGSSKLGGRFWSN